ncbi:MAG TPA: glycoside hydrolase family 2 [Rectinema sp.]|nr:glycoside hydrolase family 2 [Rectinema sp.]
MNDKHKDEMRQLYTRWGQTLDKNHPHCEYPRPQMKRQEWLCLNGIWEYAIQEATEKEPSKYDGQIVVPFSPESLLSGVGRQLPPGQMLWYRRIIEFENSNGRRILLHFGAVDQCCMVFLNGIRVGEHNGGYLPFFFDITELVRQGDNTLVICVTDDSDTGKQAYGKQKLKRGGIWYTAQSGIWQTVWAEYVPFEYIRSLRITPSYHESTVDFELDWVGAALPESIISIYANGKLETEEHFCSQKVTVKLEGFRSWSPDDPFLYTVRIDAGKDSVESYFGMREFSIIHDENGHARLALNGKPIFQTGLLDQGYWSDGLYTAPSDEAIIWELTEIKRMGFNMLRKHIKIEPLRWYYHCDRLGILVWQDFVSGGGPYNPIVTQWLPFIDVHLHDNHYRCFGRSSTEGRAIFEADMKNTVMLLYNTVSIAAWVPFNEGWGQFDACLITEKLRKIDSSRLIDSASGWHDQHCGDFQSRHVYYKRYRLKPDRYDRIHALTEFGGYSCPIEGHMASDKLFGYRMYANTQSLTTAFDALYRSEVLPSVQLGLSASIYTQVSDVEDEINGLFTYDRASIKLDSKIVSQINAELRKLGG